jgi:hypothetical protein
MALKVERSGLNKEVANSDRACSCPELGLTKNL